MLNASAISTNYFPKLIENYINIDTHRHFMVHTQLFNELKHLNFVF